MNSLEVEVGPNTFSKEWVSTGKNIFVIGHTGLVGTGILESALGNDNITGFSRGVTNSRFSEGKGFNVRTGNMREKAALHEAAKSSGAEIIVHLAAATDVDRCETDPDWANRLNVDATRNVAEVSRSLGIPLIYFSTDYRYPKSGGPFNEDSKPDPVNVYGETKLEGELAVMEVLPADQRLIIPISSPYDFNSDDKTGMPPILFHLMKKNRDLKLVSDAWTTFTHVPDIASALNKLIILKAWEEHDIVHIAGPELQTGYDVANCLLEFVPEYDGKISTVSLSEYFKGRADRPKQGGLKTDVLDKMGIKMQSLSKVLYNLQ